MVTPSTIRRWENKERKKTMSGQRYVSTTGGKVTQIMCKLSAIYLISDRFARQMVEVVLQYKI
jgi:hypothetical protein